MKQVIFIVDLRTTYTEYKSRIKKYLIALTLSLAS